MTKTKNGPLDITRLELLNELVSMLTKAAEQVGADFVGVASLA